MASGFALGWHQGGIGAAVGWHQGILMATVLPSLRASRSAPFAFAAPVDAVAQRRAARGTNTSWRRQMGSDTCVCRRVFVVTL